MTKQEKPFWQTKSLLEMSHEEWESVCDGCAKCCLVQLQDEDTDQLVFTNVVCDLLDTNKCQCTDYANRSERVPECMTLNPTNVMTAAEFAPPTCAYRLLAIGEPLPSWHPLVTGESNSTIESGQSVKNRVTPLSTINQENIEDYVVDWPVEGND